MNNVVRIGKCIGCVKVAQLDDGVCRDCLGDSKRGRKWAEMSNRIRQDSSFALSAFNEIGVRKPENELAGKLLFIRMYGVPVGAVLSPELKKLVETSLESDDPGSLSFRKEAPFLRLVR